MSPSDRRIDHVSTVTHTQVVTRPVTCAFSFYYHISLTLRSSSINMSQEHEDVKPKLNLNIAYDGTREVFVHFLLVG